MNITFGFGKKIKFDHIGFLVSEEEKNAICKNAEKMHWELDRSERRTFITTPYQFRIELQTNTDIIESMNDHTRIQKANISYEKGRIRSGSIHFVWKICKYDSSRIRQGSDP